MTSVRDRYSDLDWNYLRVPPKLQPFIRWEKQGDGEIYECCILDGWPSKVASNRSDNSYATKDLFSPHPTRPGLWKYFARLDDTIVLLNGEKANPIPLEHTVREHRNVAEAIVVGAGKPQLGLFVVAAPCTTGMTEEEIIESIQPAIELANKGQDDFGKISSSMIKVLPSDTIYPRTDKGTIIRAAFNKQLSQDIEALYQQAEVAAGTNGLTLEEDELSVYLRDLVIASMGLKDPSILANDTDFFSLGMDSLQAINIRSQILKALNTGEGSLGLNIVFEYPNIDALAHKLYSLRTGCGEVGSINSVDIMASLVEKYSNYDPHIPGSSVATGDYIVLTGTTGSLGAHILSILVSNSSVHRVYALVRAKNMIEASSRVINSLIERKLYHAMSQSDRDRILAIPADFSKKDLGLSPQIYSEVVNTVNKVIHCAWSVNFNMSILSFEEQHIKGITHQSNTSQYVRNSDGS